VDEAIDATAEHFNLRDVIEDFRLQAEEAKDIGEKNSMIERGKLSQGLAVPWLNLAKVSTTCGGTTIF